jgi:hypothetical protein
VSFREALYGVVEPSFGTAKTTPTLGTDSFFFNLPVGDAFVGIMSPVVQEIQAGGGIAVPFDSFADHYQTSIAWKGNVYPSFQKFLLPLFLTRVNAGQTLPWTTTEPPNDLASASMYVMYNPRGAVNILKQYPGCKGLSLTLSSSRQSPTLAFDATLAAQKETGNPVDSSSDPVWTLPTDAQIPTGPYTHGMSSTNFKVDGTAVTNYQSLSVKITNTVTPYFFESHFPVVMALTGRKIDVTFQRLLSTTPNYRTNWQSLANHSCYVMYGNGTNSFKLDLGARAYISAYSQQKQQNQEFLETITVTGKWDTTAGTDCTLTIV